MAKTSKPQNLKTSKPQNLKTSKPQNRTVQEILKALTEYDALPDEKRGEYLRKNGLHLEHINEWLKQIEEAFGHTNRKKRLVKNRKGRS